MNLDHMNVATVLVLALVGIAAVIGGIVTIVNPDALSFHAYLNELKWFAGAAGLLAIGRGIKSKR